MSEEEAEKAEYESSGTKDSCATQITAYRSSRSSQNRELETYCSLPSNTVTVNGVDVRSTQSQPTHINIYIKESAWAQLLKAGGSLRCCVFQPRDTVHPKSRMRHEQLALGVTQVLLGVVSCAFGGFLYCGPWNELRGSGCAFWSGTVTIAAGAATIFHEKHQSRLSGYVSVLFTLAGIATVLAATVLCVNSLTWQSDGFHYIHSVCDHPAPEITTIGYRWRRQNWRDSNWKKTQCKSYMQMVTNLFLGIRGLLLAVCVLQAVLSSTSLGMGLQSLCSQSSGYLDKKESEEKLLEDSSVPPSPSKERTPSTIACDLPGSACAPVPPCPE
ncbi:PREDICTED: transmembrane protein 176B-like [Elephantulus edwardii]|uniref:transmembrane protein 176B-like n=1 Tax=Elephantulus edwardii TaxID=28737 RepID=UPI0003F067C8|nr:PREDICTED: transmembrane protein 176B-like [Elephantulus edwardii]